MTDHNIVRMVEELIKKAASKSGGASVQASVDGTFLAKVVSVSPLAISMQNNTISSGLYINPALLLEASDIKKPFQTPFEPADTYEFLKSFHEKYVLRAGDYVIVQMAGSSFYIAGKAVAAS